MRVVPNKYPAVGPEENADFEEKGLKRRMGGFGFHELIIENADHKVELAEAPAEQLRLVIEAYRDRWKAASRDPRIRYLLIFKNYGSLAGASLEHPHSQFIALPFIPSRAVEEYEGARAHFAAKGRCVWCEEAAAADRGVFMNFHFTVVAPFVARFPFEIMVLPRRHSSDFTTMTVEEAAAFGEALQAALNKLKRRLGNPAYNLMFHALPSGKDQPSFHWHVEIIPKLTKFRAFEWGTGIYINPTPPEAAASALKAA